MVTRNVYVQKFKCKHKPESMHIGDEGPLRRHIDVENNEYEYIVCNQLGGGVITSIGGFFTGLMSVGLVKRLLLPFFETVQACINLYN